MALRTPSARGMAHRIVGSILKRPYGPLLKVDVVYRRLKSAILRI